MHNLLSRLDSFAPSLFHPLPPASTYQPRRTWTMSILPADQQQGIPHPQVVRVIQEEEVYAPQPMRSTSTTPSRNESYSNSLAPPVGGTVTTPIRGDSVTSSLDRPHFVAEGEGNAVVPSDTGIRRNEAARRRDRISRRGHHHSSPRADTAGASLHDTVLVHEATAAYEPHCESRG